VFNLACGSQHTLLAIAEAIGKFLGRTLERRHVESRAGDVRHTKADIGKAERLLAYRPTVQFDEGMQRTCEYFVQRFGKGR
jgi:UDP-glucose 4-epimerase